jgi:hypothetical protein
MEDDRSKAMWLRDCLRQIRKVRLYPLFVAAIVIIVPITAAASALVPERFVILTVYTSRLAYASGESIHIHTSLTNCGWRVVELTYPSGGIICIDIYDSRGQLVFFAPKYVLAWMVEITLKPMETMEHEFIWEQEDRTDEGVRLPGTFLIVASSHSDEARYTAHGVPFYISS